MELCWNNEVYGPLISWALSEKSLQLRHVLPSLIHSLHHPHNRFLQRLCQNKWTVDGVASSDRYTHCLLLHWISWLNISPRTQTIQTKSFIKINIVDITVLIMSRLSYFIHKFIYPWVTLLPPMFVFRCRRTEEPAHVPYININVSLVFTVQQVTCTVYVHFKGWRKFCPY